MTCDERLEKLLNRAGQTISDLPKGDGLHMIYDKDLRKGADKAQREWHGISPDGYIDVIDDLHMHQDYILHLTDIIDRMETALENVCVERDWLKKMARFDECPTCSNHIKGDIMVCGIEGDWLENEFGECGRYEYSGVPEDWSVDDERQTDAG